MQHCGIRSAIWASRLGEGGACSVESLALFELTGDENILGCFCKATHSSVFTQWSNCFPLPLAPCGWGKKKIKNSWWNNLSIGCCQEPKGTEVLCSSFSWSIWMKRTATASLCWGDDSRQPAVCDATSLISHSPTRLISQFAFSMDVSTSAGYYDYWLCGAFFSAPSFFRRNHPGRAAQSRMSDAGARLPILLWWTVLIGTISPIILLPMLLSTLAHRANKYRYLTVLWWIGVKTEHVHFVKIWHITWAWV